MCYCMEAVKRCKDAKDAGKRVHTIDDVHSFTLRWFMAECRAHGVDLVASLKDEEASRLAYRRMLEWKSARLRWHIFYGNKLCPDQTNPDQKVRRASFAGYLCSERQRQEDNPFVQDFLTELKTASRHVHRSFTKWMHDPKPARWKYPLLDSWLLCIWPIVEQYRWRYADVLNTARKKFDDTCSMPFNSLERMRYHCKSDLQLRVKKGRVPRKKSAPTPFSALAVAIPAELPPDSPFPKKRK